VFNGFNLGWFGMCEFFVYGIIMYVELVMFCEDVGCVVGVDVEVW